MTLGEIKIKVLSLIEEYDPESDLLTSDPDIAQKLNSVINQIMYELARIKKIARYTELPVIAGDLITFEDLREAVGAEIYQVGKIKGVHYEAKASNSIFKILSTGTAEIDVYIYPQRVNDDTPAEHKLELSDDALEIMPYGVAADLLKSDVSTEYGSVYGTRYESMLERLDPRNSISNIYVDGGVMI